MSSEFIWASFNDLIIHFLKNCICNEFSNFCCRQYPKLAVSHHLSAIVGIGLQQDSCKDRQQLIWPILVWSQYIEDKYGPHEILYTHYILFES